MQSDNAFTIHLPEVEKIEQGKEFFILDYKDRKEKIEFHDYDRIFEVPGLYEYLFHEQYKCNSPEVVCELLKTHIEEGGKETEPLHALDIGAGNGMVGEQLAGIGADSIVAVDIIEEAAEAARRDRPGLYRDYHVADLTDLTPEVESSLEATDFNCMTVVAALGFGDIPPGAFAQGYNLLSSPAWVAFNIKENFVSEDDLSGFSKLIGRMDREGILDIRERRRYRHRFCQDGTPLYYYAVVGEKQNNIPPELFDDLL